MNEHFSEIPSTSLKEDNIDTSINFNNFDTLIKEEFPDLYHNFLEGKTLQKNKKVDIINIFFKNLIEHIDQINNQNIGDNNNNLFKINKKIIKNNIESLQSIFNLYELKDDKITFFILGTLIQYIYECRK